jgi:hypothetical protein
MTKVEFEDVIQHIPIASLETLFLMFHHMQQILGMYQARDDIYSHLMEISQGIS